MHEEEPAPHVHGDHVDPVIAHHVLDRPIVVHLPSERLDAGSVALEKPGDGAAREEDHGIATDPEQSLVGSGQVALVARGEPAACRVDPTSGVAPSVSSSHADAAPTSLTARARRWKLRGWTRVTAGS